MCYSPCAICSILCNLIHVCCHVRYKCTHIYNIYSTDFSVFLSAGAIELSVFSEYYHIELDVVDVQSQRIDRFGG